VAKEKAVTQARGIILFGHGARDPAWAAPMQRSAARIAERAPEVAVELAFLEFLTPDLNGAVDRLAARGVRDIVVVPVFLAQGGHLKRDVPVLVEAAAARHAELRLTLATAAGESAEVVEAIASYALRV
jgi:sirohydrochlorin cobaltochelatase